MSRWLLAALAVAALVSATSAASTTQRVVSADEAVWSPNGKQIAFINSHNYIYVMNLDGSGLRRITPGGAKGDLAWSPNGKWIAYVDTRESIEEVRPDGKRHRSLTVTGVTQPDFSPSGQRIAYTNYRTYGHAIQVMYADGSEQTPVTSWQGDGEVLNYPTWSPNGRRIAFGVGDEGDSPAVNPHVAIIAYNGGPRTDLAFGHNVTSMDWSPDGRKILLVESNIAVLDLRTETVRSLGQNAFYKAHWSPSGRKILFTNERGILVMNSDGSHVHQLLPARY